MNKIIHFLEKAFVSVKGKSLQNELFAHYLAKVAKSNSYVETFCRHADTLHSWVKQGYEQDFRRAFEIVVRSVIKGLRVRRAELVFDVTKEPFYGKTRNLHVFNTPQSEHYRGEFHFITCCLINKGKQIPLMALPVRLGEQVKLTIDLIRYCQSIFPNIAYALFDRGFYCAELIDYLESSRINYLIFVPVKKGKLKAMKEETSSFASYNHTLCYTKAKSTWKPSTKIVVCKEVFDFDWMFATNIQLSNPKDYVLLYKRRWQIETNYRVEDEARIKSKSAYYLIRYFYFLISNIFHILWIMHKKLSYYVPFKRYLDIIETRLFYNFIGLEKA